MQNYIEQFKNTMVKAGITPPSEIIEDGQIHRFSTNNKSHDVAGWYVLHAAQVPAGCFGDWRTGVTSIWSAKSKDEMSTKDWIAYRHLIEKSKHQRNKIRAQEQQFARDRARYIWDSSDSASHHHPYLLKKRVSPYLARQRGDTLVLPITNFDNEIQSLQFISSNGSKMLLSNGAKKGNFIPINQLANPIQLLICEGFATGATLAATFPDKCIIAAIDAGNLEPVAVAARRRWPNMKFLICADDDRLTADNPGLTRARQAAVATGAEYAAPKWPVGAPATLTDFNDLFNWLPSYTKETA